MAASDSPAIVSLDEPMLEFRQIPDKKGDVSIQTQIINLLDELQDRLRLTYLFISHDSNMSMPALPHGSRTGMKSLHFS